MKTAVAMINLSPSVPLDFDVLDRVWKGKDVSYAHLRVFGCRAFVHVPRDERSKLDSKTKQCIFLGSEDDEFGYRLWDPKEKKIVRSRDVIFFEDQTIEDFEQKEKTESTTFIPSNSNPRPTPQLPLMPVNHGGDLQNDDNGGFLNEPLVGDPESANDDIDVIPEQVMQEAPDDPQLRRSTRPRQPSTKYSPHESHRYCSSGDWDGERFALIKQLNWLHSVRDWFLFWAQPKVQADVYGLCVAFGVFNENSSSYDCECLKGFKPLVQNDWSSGCVRKSPLQCQNKRSVGKEDGFLKISNLTLPANSKTYQKVSAERCRLDCLEICSCVAYAYNKNSGCSLWEGDLINLQQHSEVAGAEIYIRLAASEPELQIGNGSTRTGDTLLMQQLYWSEAVWNWTMFWSQPRDQAEVYGSCGVFGVFQRNSSCECLKGFTQLVQNDWSSGCVRKSPLQCQNKRSVGKEDGFLKISNLTLPANSKTYQKVSAERCRLDCLEICSCVAYAYNKNSGCSLWEGDLINLQQHSEVAGAEIYIRLAASEPELQIGNGSTRTDKNADAVIPVEKSNIKRTVRTTLAVAIPTTLITFGLFMYFRCLRKGKLIHRGKQHASHNLLLFDFDTDPSSTNRESSSVDNRKNRWSKNMELPLFSYESVSVATGQFSDKLGEGGFGPVYKAWKLWNSNKASDLMDPSLGDPPSTATLLRYINIGLLCVQESPADRPTTSDVISMIVNEHVALPEPKQPAFVAGRNVAEQRPLMSSSGVPSVNSMTITAIDGR
ncbi:hypothetical protein POTOM_020372 [Populus tomentosa]|uniref:Apple domain-containing protein n=1 Tax=Populus tomentosa TaxID=118781 RepID=A0A8X7ZVJ2_POPTO|nr:hypothetical protein POTOM_020372 [Populus tomentosa]